MAFGTGTVLTNSGRAITANRIKGTGTEPVYLGVGTGATGAARTASAADSALSTQYSTRATGTSSVATTTTSNDTYQVVGLVTAGASIAVDEAGLFDASTAGNMYMSATFPVVNLASGDSIQATMKVAYA
jgi:hypothetical protein